MYSDVLHIRRVLKDLQYRGLNSATPKELPAAVLSADHDPETSRTQRDRERKRRSKANTAVEHTDIIKDDFWEQRPWLISEG